jgi:hypothetical protein
MRPGLNPAPRRGRANLFKSKHPQMRDGFDRGHDLAQRLAKDKIRFVNENLRYLRKGDRKGKHEKALRQFTNMAERNERFSPNQLSYVDGLYEKTMKGAGLPSVGQKFDVRKRY